MKELYEKKAVLHSLIWLAFYLVLNTITNNIADSMKIDSIMINAIPNFLLALVCFLYLRRARISEEIGLLSPSTEKPSVMLYYIPLLALPFINLFYGFNTSLSPIKIVLLLLMYTGVGFMEEIIFRGLMFKALLKKWNRYIVVIFISLTFAVGHIVSMVAVGMSGTNTILQIINAFVVGFMFMAVILASGNLTICVITHTLYNFLADLSMVGSTHPEVIAINTVITVLYFLYLLLKAKNVKAYFMA